ncbi:MAG: AAA family ATPase [Nitrospirota bacterium]|nr:AAA family ATPase [Nitrospirota bacterium]
MSYLEFYNFKEQPFDNTVDEKFYFNNSQHDEAQVRLKYAIDNMKGLGILVGGIGTGKTTLARMMLEDLSEHQYEAALLVIVHSSITAEWLLKKIAMQLGVREPSDNRVELISQLFRRLVSIKAGGKKAVVLVDEAQMLNSREIMEEIRGLLNLEEAGSKLITFILFGLPDLDDCLSLDEPLKQRTGVRFKLTSLQQDIVCDYIRHRLNVAGCEREVFSDTAIRAIGHYSQGIPRLINTICDNALLEGYLLKREVVEDDLVKNVANDLGLIPAEAAS